MQSLGYTRAAHVYGRPAGQQLRPEFYMDAVRDEAASAQAGREIFKEVERVRTIIPGITATVAVHNVNSTHVERWPEEYEAFKKGLAMPISGTPLEEWPILNRSMVKELRYREIRTVEELARLNDHAVGNIGMGGMMLRERAKAFIDDSAREALTSRLTAENDGMRSRIATLEHQVAELGRHLTVLSEQNRDFAESAHRARNYMPPDALANTYGTGVPQAVMETPVSALDALASMPFTRRRPADLLDAEHEEAAVSSRHSVDGRPEAA